jgi:hypothetical protein
VTGRRHHDLGCAEMRRPPTGGAAAHLGSVTSPKVRQNDGAPPDQGKQGYAGSAPECAGRFTAYPYAESPGGNYGAPPPAIACPFPGIPGATLRDGSCAYLAERMDPFLTARPSYYRCPLHGTIEDDP